MKYYNFRCGCSFPLRENGEDLVFDIKKINQDCPAVWNLLDKGLTTGVFQLETETGKNWVQKLKPRSIRDLAALGSILRPGCLNCKDSNNISVTEHYCRRKNGQEEVTYPHPELEELLRETYGQNIYQEQSIEILKIIGGFDLVQADLARRGIGKKKAEIIEEVRLLFLKKTQEIGKVSLEKAEEIFNLIKASEKYSFNRSHAVAYAFITYWTAYQKVHSPLNFFVSKLRHAHYKQDSFEKISDLVLDAKLFDIEVKLPDLRQKKPWFWTDKKLIYYGITNIKSVGKSSFDSIIEYITQAEQSLGKPLNDFSFLEFCIFCGWDISEKTSKLINAGALDFFKKTRAEMCYLFDTIKDLTKDVEFPNAKALYLEKKPKDFIEFFELAAKTTKQGGICHSEKRALVLQNKLKILKEPVMSLRDTTDVIITTEEDLLGVSITHDINKFDSDTPCKDILNGKNTNSILGVRIKSIYTNVIKTGNNKGREMAKIVIFDSTGTLTGLVFADTWEKMKPLVSEGQNILIKGQKQKDNNNFIVRELCQVI